MKPSRALLSLALASLFVLSACGASTDAAITVGDDHVSHDDLVEEIEQMIARPDLFVALFGLCPTTGEQGSTEPCPATRVFDDGTYPRELVTFVIRQRVFFMQVGQGLEARDIEPSGADRQFVDQALSQQGPDGRVYIELAETGDEAADEAYTGSLLDDFTSQVALQNVLDENAFSAFIEDANQDVSIDSRYGTWDPLFGDLNPPAGPVPLSEPVGIPEEFPL